jgi:hypothetical protein
MTFTPIQKLSYDDITTKMLISAPVLLREGREAAIKAAGVTERTFQRWLKTDLFLSILTDLRGDAVRETSIDLGILKTKAVTTLDALMDDPTTPAAVKAKVADIILARQIQYRELQLTTDRVAELERQLEELRMGE